MSTRGRYWPWLRDLGLAALLLGAVRAYQHRGVRSGVAPAIAATDLYQHALSLSDYRGHPVLLHFWATWCGVCRAEESNILALSTRVPVLTVASRSGKASEVLEYARAHGLKFPILNDPTGVLAERYGVTAYPTTFIVDRSGTIRHVEVGYTTTLGLQLRMWLVGSPFTETSDNDK